LIKKYGKIPGKRSIKVMTPLIGILELIFLDKIAEKLKLTVTWN